MRKRVSGIILTLLLIGMLTSAVHIQPVKASGTIYIRADGSIDPPTAPIQRDGDTFTLTDNITADTDADGIVIERDSIVLDGAGYSLQGTGPSSVCNGIVLIGRNHVTIENIRITAFYFCVWLNFSSYNSMSGNTIANSVYGIYLVNSVNNTLSDNTFTSNSYFGISLESSSSNNVNGNTIANSLYGIYLDRSSYNSVSGNTVTASGNFGIDFYSSSYNNMTGNTVTNSLYGINLAYSSCNNVNGNTAANNHFGIYLCYSYYNNMNGNAATNNYFGVYLSSSSSNSISENTLTANDEDGIYLDSSSSNIISGNNITANSYEGIGLYSSSSNTILHNNLANNTWDQASVSIYHSIGNVWDDGYPSGGNYWSDCNNTDSFSGPYQTETGSDGIGDTPYVIDSSNIDHYPLMKPWTGAEPTWTLIAISPSPVATDSPVNCTATVSGSSPTGTVTWSTNSSTGSFTSLTSTLSSGSCSTNYTDTNAGIVTITASYSGDANNSPSSGHTTLTVGLWSIATNWDPSRDSYLFPNHSPVFSQSGWCYGMSSTALLYFEKYYQTPFINPSAPFFPSQTPEASNTSSLNDSGIDQNVLNNVTLAIMVHHAFDPQNGWWATYTALWSAWQNEPYQFEELLSNLARGQPVVLLLGDLFLLHKHAVVAYAVRELPNGNYSIAISDPNGRDRTFMPSYDPSTKRFDYYDGIDYTVFAVVVPQPIQSSWFALPPSGWTPTFEPNYWLVMADKNVTVETNTSPSESDTFSEMGNSSAFVDNIPESCGISEGNVEVYALPVSPAWFTGPFPAFPYVVHDPSQSNNSTIMITWVDNSTGQFVGYGYLLNVTTMQESLDFTATPCGAGLSISAGDNALNATVTCFSANQQGYSVSDVLTAQIDAGQSVNLTAPCLASFTPSKNVVGKGYPIPMNTTITNLGTNPENASLTLRGNATTLDSEMVFNLLNGTSIDLTCVGNTSNCDYGNYTLSIYCEPNGINEAANNFTYMGIVTVTIPGDITGLNGSPDGKVDMRDIGYVARRFMCNPGDPLWDPNADINGDGKIDMRDIGIAARNYGQHYP